MPEYQIPVSNIADWNNLDEFTQGYIEAMFFTENSPAWSKSDIESDPQQWENALSEGTSDGTIPHDAETADIEPESLLRIRDQCAAFQIKAHAELMAAIDQPGYDLQRAGNDFWFTRNGHGVGFWDRDLGETGDRLTAIAENSEVFIEWHDGMIIHD